MLVEKPIQGECSRALDDYYQSQCDGQQMILNPVPFLGCEPVQEQAKSKMNGGDSAYHRKRDDQRCNSAEQPDDQSDSTGQFPGDDQKGQSGRKVQMFGEREHAAGETRSAIPTQHFLSAMGKKYYS